MNTGAARVIAEGFLKGAFDVLDAMLALSFKYTVSDLHPLVPNTLQDDLGLYPVVLRAKIRSGGAVALLLAEADAALFATMVLSAPDPAKDTIDDSDLATLREIAEPCLGGGITNLMEKFGRNVEQPDAVSVGLFRTEKESDLVAFLGTESVAAPFTFSAPPEITGQGLLLFAQKLEEFVPPNLAKKAEQRAGAEVAPELSESEMNDILSGFSPDDEPVSHPETESSSKVHASSLPPPNIDMVLDIRLVATVRLGHIEVPISDVLNLGPGSIIPVGHLVDEPVELLVNDKLIARGDVVVVDEKFGLRITEIVSPQERIESMR